MPELLDFSDLTTEQEEQAPTPEETPARFRFLEHSLFPYKEERIGDKLFIGGRVGRQQTVGEVGQQVFDQFDSDDNARIDISGSQATITFTEPVEGIRQIEFNILEAE